MVNNPKFRCLVEADAKAILDRQETDSIDIIDEIRYVLRTCNLTTSGIEMGSMVSCAARVYLFLYLQVVHENFYIPRPLFRSYV